MTIGMIARTPRILLTGTIMSVSALLMLTGCEKDRDDPAPASATSAAQETTPRPEALSAATNEIKAGKTAEAQTRLEAFLEQEPKHVYRAEALYLLGQSLAAQGQYEDGKKKLDAAIDATHDRTLKGLALLGRADCNMAMKKYSLASRQYHWLETMYRDVKAIPQDELMYKLGLACKNSDAQESADYWFKQVIELYSTGPYAADAKLQHSKYTPEDPNVAPRVFTLEVSSYGKREKAEEDAAILREKGYRDVQIVETTRNSFPIYEVHVGKFENKNAAVHAQTDAELAGLATTIRPSTIEHLK
jgi:TolA-binding protein